MSFLGSSSGAFCRCLEATWEHKYSMVVPCPTDSYILGDTHHPPDIPATRGAISKLHSVLISRDWVSTTVTIQDLYPQTHITLYDILSVVSG